MKLNWHICEISRHLRGGRRALAHESPARPELFWVVLHYSINWIVVHLISFCIVIQSTYCIVLCCTYCVCLWSIVLFLRDPPHHALKSQSGPDQPLISDAVCVLQSLRWFWISEKPLTKYLNQPNPVAAGSDLGSLSTNIVVHLGNNCSTEAIGQWSRNQSSSLFKKLPLAIHCIKHLGTNCSNWAITSHSTSVQDIGQPATGFWNLPSAFQTHICRPVKSFPCQTIVVQRNVKMRRKNPPDGSFQCIPHDKPVAKEAPFKMMTQRFRAEA